MTKPLCCVFLAVLAAGCTSSAVAQSGNFFSDWPTGTSPQEVGKNLAEHFVSSPHQYTETIHYSEADTWYGALTFAQLTHDDALRAELIHKFDPLMPGEPRRRGGRCAIMWMTRCLALCRWRSRSRPETQSI